MRLEQIIKNVGWTIQLNENGYTLTAPNAEVQVAIENMTANAIQRVMNNYRQSVEETSANDVRLDDAKCYAWLANLWARICPMNEQWARWDVTQYPFNNRCCIDGITVNPYSSRELQIFKEELTEALECAQRRIAEEEEEYS